MQAHELGTSNIMIVDDTAENLRLLTSMLADRGVQVRAFPDGEMALKAAFKAPPDLVLLDINMPGVNGYEVCRRLKESALLRDIPVLFISAAHETEAKIEAFRQGGVDYITKPFRFEEVYARLQTHLKLRELQRQLERQNHDLEERVLKQVKQISDAQQATILALAKLSESRDDDTGHHIERVQEISRILADSMMQAGAGIDADLVTQIHLASPLHDIGKVGIPDAILLKPGKLTPDEFEVIKGHTTLGANTLEAVQRTYPGNAFVRTGLDIALRHHERWDGTGYPGRIQGLQIPVSARIVAVADVYDALRSKRPYKDPWPHARARDTIVEQSGRQFDPAVIEAFQRVEAELDAIRTRLDD